MYLTEDPLEAADCLKRGGLVVFPTETVYGIGANGFNLEACRRVYEVKGRPSDNPLIQHVSNRDTFFDYGGVKKEILDALYQFIPGPLTLILPKKIEGLFSAGLSTVGLRMPLSEVAIEMIRAAGCPVAAPSANLSGKPSLTRLDDVLSFLGDRVDMILKGPDPVFGLESSVVDLSGEVPIYLRAGMVPFEELQNILPDLKRWRGGRDVPPPSPGLKYRHYAPDGKVVIYDDPNEVEEGMGAIGFEVGKGNPSLKISTNEEYAKELYAFFTLCDKKGIKKIFCQLPGEGGLYESLLERLQKAQG